MLIHHFNSFTGRLQESSCLQPLYPISVHPLNKVDSPKMIWDTVKTKPLKTISSTAFSTLDPKLLAKYKKFQENLEKPVFLMGGPRDKILFGITVGLVILTTANSFRLLYDMAFPKKN